MSEILVCFTCKSADGEVAGGVLAQACAGLAEGTEVSVLPVRCLGNCKRGPTAVLRHPGRWSYVFGGLDATADAQALIDGARLLAGSTDGLMPWRGRPDCLKRGMIARVPPLDFPGETA